MTKTERKQAIQDLLIQSAASAFYKLGDGYTDFEADDELAREEMRKQFQRIEKLFGIVPGSTAI